MNVPKEIEEAEIAEKTGRLVRLLAERRLGGVLLGTQHNFAWITGGRTNGVDLSREVGAATVLVAADGRRWLLANVIEMPRLLAEELPGGDFRPVELPWTEPVLDRARDLLGGAPGGARLAADWPLADLEVVEQEVGRLRSPLTAPELGRFRALGRDAGEALGEVCRGLRPGMSEWEIAQRTAAALGARGASAVVLLVAADDRIARFRHPLPTHRRWEQGVMVVACARRAGLTAALTRIVWAGAVPDEVRSRTRAAANVAARLLAATRPGAVGKELFAVAAQAYADLGFPGEERLHHQGGPCGYLSRDWIAQPGCEEVVQDAQGFAWNPSITGTKVEETCIATESGIEVITATPGWPALDVEAGGRSFAAPDVASLENL
ncbi:MAG TPA: M24 family metallopeptidase [Thermoanaerobaculia bacterium]|nr:M24 family metallopeptidase [Thermoanaerobaculia bacterium]